MHTSASSATPPPARSTLTEREPAERLRPAAEPSASLGGRPAALLGDLSGPVGVIDDTGRIVVTGAAMTGTAETGTAATGRAVAGVPVAETADGFVVEWGVVAEDRWRLGHEERLRRRRLDDTPVQEMLLRVPDGDVILRVAVVNDGVGRSLMLEFHNASSAPLLAAVACRRTGLLEATGTGSGQAISADGQAWVAASRSVGAVAACSDADADADSTAGEGIWGRVMAEPDARRAEAAGVSAAAALLVPLPHRQTVSFMVGVGGPPLDSTFAAADVASGWKAITRKALTLSWPDPDLSEAWTRVVGDLVVLAGSADPAVAAAAAPHLDVAGLSEEADRARATVVAAASAGGLSGHAAVAALRALASRELVPARPSGLDVLAGPLAHSAGDCLDHSTLAITAAALEGASPAAAQDARRLARSVSLLEPEPSAVRPSAVATAILARLIADPWSPSSAELLPGFPADWQGRDLEVAGLHSACGVLSFALRWHGERPALLWERLGGPDEATLTIGALDPHWSTSLRSGEALLAASR